MSDLLDRPLHVCAGCGALSEDVERALAYRDSMIEQLGEDVANLERELRGKRARIKQLERNQDQQRMNEPVYDAAMEVLEHWKAVLSPKARELGGKRLDSVIARLKAGYTQTELMRCADGYALKPYVVDGRRTHDGPKDAWQADAELIYRDAKRVDNGLRIMDRADDLRQVLGHVEEDPGPSAGGAGVGELSPIGRAALKMAGHGFAVFPVEARGKRPVTPNGLKDAKRDPAAIAACWTKHPHLNVAVATGAASGIVVLDVDGEEGWDSLLALQEEHQDLPDTLSVKTPGGGHHFYFQHPGVEVRNTAGFPREFLDVRGDGGYVVAPPSVGSGGRKYEVDEELPIASMPSWLLELLTGYQRKVDSTLAGGFDLAKFVSDGASAGQRNQRMTQGVGKLFSYGMNAAEVFAFARLANQTLKPPLSDKELGNIVKSIARKEARKP
jgi:hypothetical protein